MILAVLLLLSCMLTGVPTAQAAGKTSESRAIAIVFDNSGSMYDEGDRAWCRATYAMEVFAAMLNDGDTLMIYPMNPITIGSTEYTMDRPYRISDASQASTIREIYTPWAGGTPIESIDCAAAGLSGVQADKKYLIILTDGGNFSLNDQNLSNESTRDQLNMRIKDNAGKDMTIMYLGIGNAACKPTVAESEYFVKKMAANSVDVLNRLTEMCNLVFGRDSMPSNHINGTTVDFDITMKKLIVFVQGENIDAVSLTDSTGNPVGRQVSSQQTHYATEGSGNYNDGVDNTLQGMMVTYADCPAGTYTLNYTGSVSSVDIYYEPDADLDFVFTDMAGNPVEANALYEDTYKVSFGIKDAQTGQLIASDLLGKPHYEGKYWINGQEHPLSHDGYSGEATVDLKMNDTFAAEMTVTYLSGYTITKNNSDFGWDLDGIQVAPRPAGDLRLEITGGDDLYSLQRLEEGTPFIATVYYQGQQLTGAELENVSLEWEPEKSNAEIKKTFLDDHYELTLHYKDPADPQSTVCGPCTVTIYAVYAPPGYGEATAPCPVSYNINDDFSPLQLELDAPEDYIVISQLKDSQPITVNVKCNGTKMSPLDFAGVELQVDCDIPHTVTRQDDDSSFLIQLEEAPGIAEGDYPVVVSAVYTDNIGRTTQVEDSIEITLSNIPLWIKWAVSLALLFALIALVLCILHIRVLPSKANVTKKNSSMNFDGEEETKSTTFDFKIKKGQATLQSKYAGVKSGISMDVKPGKESYLRKPQARRSAEVKPATLRKLGNATIQEVSIGSIKYVLNEETNKLERLPKSDKPFLLKHGMTISYTGTMMNAGIPKPFTVSTKLNFKKK